MKTNCIIIPIYKQTPNLIEITSLKSLSKNLMDFQDYEVYIIYPENIVISEWKRYIGHDIILRSFDPKYFISILSYSKLLLSYDFWNSFKEHKYALIYQTDGYCIGGNLKQFIEMDYDYIGGPIISPNARWFNVPAIGNGGVSLRKIETMLEVTDPNGEFMKCSKEDIDRHNKANGNMYEVYEDLYFAQLVPMLWEFKKPKFDIGAAFSFDMNADYVYDMVKDNKLPLFAHAYDKNIRFWQNHISELDNIDIITECENINSNGYLSSSTGYQVYLPHKKPINVCAIMCVKNENYHLNEQVKKLLKSGISKVFIVDNNLISGENPNDVIEDSINIEIINKFRGERFSDNYDLITNMYKYVYDNYAYDNYSYKFDYALFIDADEDISFLSNKSLRQICYDNHEYPIIKINVENIDNNGNVSDYQGNCKYKYLVKTNLELNSFTREGPITQYKAITIPDIKIFNHITCDSLENYKKYKLHRGYPDMDQIIGKKCTSMELYNNVNKSKGSTLEIS